MRGSDGTQLAIEVDGPHHFSVNPPYRPLASTDMRNRLLAHQGWRVIRCARRSVCGGVGVGGGGGGAIVGLSP